MLDFPWLTEVHSKIWNRKHLEPQLFRKVEVTRDHYAELQKRLEGLHPDRNLPGYFGGTSDVLSVKLDFLRSFPRAEALSPRHPADDDDSEASNEDDEIKSLFPSILSFLDLSILKLKKKLPPRFPLPLLLRQEYKVISNLIKARPQSSAGSVIFCGQPGTGKTAYLYLRIIENMIDGCPFLYQDMGGTVYHVSEEGVEPVRSWSSENPIVAFVDNDKDYGPGYMLVNQSVQLIVPSSPDGAFQKWTRQLGHASSVTRLVVERWSHEELLLTGIFLHPHDLSSKLLRESTSYFGYNPRQCFHASESDASLKDIMNEVASTIRVAARNKPIMLLDETRDGYNVSHAIFQNFPTNTDKRQLLSNCQFDTVSRWALEHLLHQYNAHKAEVTADFYFNILRIPGTAPLRGHLFERQVLNHLCSITTGCEFSIRRLTDSNQTTWTYRGPIQHITFQESTVVNEITKAVQNQKSLHLVPSARNFTAVDSIVYDPNDQDAVITFIQITTNAVHPIVVSGLQRIQRWFKSLGGLRPTKSRPWRFLFIVPLVKASSFDLQKFDSDTCTDVWAGKVQQCVLGLKEKTIFGRRSDSSVQREQQMMDVEDIWA